MYIASVISFFLATAMLLSLKFPPGLFQSKQNGKKYFGATYEIISTENLALVAVY